MLLLLEKGANVTAGGDQNFTALYGAARGGFVGAATLLLEKGADVNARSSADGSVLQSAATAGHLDVLRLLLDWEADVNVPANNWSVTTLGCAAQNGYIDAMTLLLARGANLELHDSDQDCNSALRIAAIKGQLNAVRFLLDKGADPNDQSRVSDPTIVSEAVYSDRIDVVRLLLERGADDELPDGSDGLGPTQAAECEDLQHGQNQIAMMTDFSKSQTTPFSVYMPRTKSTKS